MAENLPTRPVALGMSEAQMFTVDRKLGDGRSLLTGFAAEGIHELDPLSKEDVERGPKKYFPDAWALDCDAHNWNDDPLLHGTWRIDPPETAYDFPRIMNEPEGRVLFAVDRSRSDGVEGTGWKARSVAGNKPRIARE